MRVKSGRWILSSFFLVSMAARADTIVFQQTPASPVVSTSTSQFITPPGGFGFNVYDNFSIAGGATVHQHGSR